METGLKAWIACRDPETSQIELPGGWCWKISDDSHGYLMTPDEKCCVGYDLDQAVIRFGSNGETKAPGLNAWTVQEMGERFARDHFMDNETAAIYDAFAKERRTNRQTYERGVRSEFAGLIQLELSEGSWLAHVDVDAVKDLTGIDTEAEIGKKEAVMLFNEMSEARHVMPLRDPLGYMTLDGNLYEYVKDQYDFQYNEALDNIDDGFINGNGRGCEAVLDKLDSNVRKNIREYCLPERVNYSDLRYIEATPELSAAVDEFVKQRVTKTINYEKRRSHSKESLAKDHEKFLAAGEGLKDAIEAAALPPLDVTQDMDINLNQ